MTFTISQSPNSSNLYLYPTGDSSCSLTASAGSNYACVDETWSSPNDTDYVYTDSESSVSDWYTATNHTTETGTINFVRLFSRARSYSTTQESDGVYRLWVDDTSSTASSSNQAPLTTSFTKYYATFATKPSGGVWTWTDIDAMLFGVGCSSPTSAGQEQVMTLRPSAAGNSNELERQSLYVGDATNYTYVDDVGTHDGTTTYLDTGLDSYQTDSYTVEDAQASVVSDAPTIKKIRVYNVCATNANTHYSKTVLRTHDTTYFGSQETATTSWQYFYTDYTSNPSTSVAWTWAEINAMEIGVSLKKNVAQAGKARTTQVYAEVTYYANPEIQMSQEYAVVNYTPPTSTVTLNTPDSLTVAHSRTVGRYTFPAGDYEVTDYGRAGKALSLTGLEYASADTEMASIKDMCHYGEKVTVAGLPDTNLNTDYMIRNFTWSEEAGHTNRMYRWAISLEEC